MSDAPEQAAEGQEKKKGGMMVLLIAGLVGVGGGSALGAMVLGPMVGARMADAAPSVDGSHAEPAGGGHGEDDGHGGGGDHGEGGGGEAAGSLHVVDNLVVNPAGSNGTRFLLATIVADLGGRVDPESIGDRDYALRDALIRVLAKRTVAELGDVSKREEILEELRAAFDSVLGEGVTGRLFIPQWVIQ